MTRLRGAKPGSQESMLNAGQQNMFVKLGAKIDKTTTPRLMQGPRGIEKTLQPMLRQLEHANPISEVLRSTKTVDLFPENPRI